MPTKRTRHAITETEDIAQALASARRAWPNLAENPNELLRGLILAGEHALADADEKRRQAIEATTGVFTGTFPPGFLDELRQDWPDK